MMDYEALENALYGAFLEGAKALGPDLKRLSWFGRNKSGAALDDSQQLLRAA